MHKIAVGWELKSPVHSYAYENTDIHGMQIIDPKIHSNSDDKEKSDLNLDPLQAKNCNLP